MSLLISLFVGSFLFCGGLEARIEDTVTLSAENKNFSGSEINWSKVKSVFKENGYEINEVQATSRDNRGRKFHETIIILSRPKAPCSEAANEISEMKAQLQKAIEDQKSAHKISALFNHLLKDLEQQNTNGNMCKMSVKLSFKKALGNRVRAKRFWGGGSDSGSSSSSSSSSSGSSSSSKEICLDLSITETKSESQSG
ncbi:uncharacterized protein [Montipora capricornis]|uniref:uncharacterized protein isoform X1 n=1 Tax=Montipora capricornis TaxID=246305 RepID=UPI0035F0FF46